MAALTKGGTSEPAAVEVAAATAATDVDTRREADRRLARHLGTLSPRQLGRAARTVVAELDAAGVVARRDAAVASRRVTCRPAPDGMAHLTVLGPVTEVVGAHAALRRHADAVTTAHGPEGELPEGRSAGAVMADAALRRLSGRALGEGQPVAVQLVMTDRTLTGLGDPARSAMVPARLVGHGPFPAPTAREWLRENPHAPEQVQAWVRRVFTAPGGRDLVALESKAALFPPALREFLVLRDDTCHTPFCDAPIVHADHVHPRAGGGSTTAANGQGACARCNLTKEAPGWHHASTGGRTGPHRVTVTTPTGQTHHSTAPPLLGHGSDPPDDRIDVGSTHDPWDDVDWSEIFAEHPDWLDAA